MSRATRTKQKGRERTQPERGDHQSAAAYIPLWLSGMSAANDSPLESLHVPWRDSDLRAKLERYQMVVSEHQWRRQHMLNWQFEPLQGCLCSKSLTCNAHSGPAAHENRSYSTSPQRLNSFGPHVPQL